MRVLFLVGHKGIYAGGAHQSLYALRGLARAGVEVGAIWGDDDDADRTGFRRLKDLGIPYWIIPIHKFPTPASLWKLRRVITSFKPDVIEAVQSGAQFHVLIAGLFLRFGLVFYRGISAPLRAGHAWKYRLKRVNRVIANCTDLRDMMVKDGQIDAGKIEVIPGEFDPACSDPLKINSDGLREELGIPQNVPIVTHLANYAPWRGQDITLEAASILARNNMRFHVVFAGRETEKLAPLVKKHGLEKMVTLSRYRRDPERLLKESWVAVNASTGNESLAGSVLNAQAMGVPAVITSLAGAADAIDDGTTGFIIPTRDAQILAEAVGTILQLQGDDYIRMRKAARNRALKLFSSEERAKRRIECYTKCVRV